MKRQKCWTGTHDGRTSFQLKQNLTWPSLSLGGSCFSYDSAQSKVTNFMQCSLSIWILTSESWFCQNKYVDSEFEVQVGCVGQYGRPFDVVRLTRALAACLPSKRSSITEDSPSGQVAKYLLRSFKIQIYTVHVLEFWKCSTCQFTRILIYSRSFSQKLWCIYRFQNTNNTISLFPQYLDEEMLIIS